MDRGAWQATVYGVTKSQTLVSDFTSLYTYVYICVCVCIYIVAQLCLTLCDPMDCPAGSSVHRILQARVLEWVAIPFSRGSSGPRDRTQVSYAAGRFSII